MNPLAGLWEALREGVRILGRSGDGPVVITLISVATIGALALHAPQLETLLVDFVGLGAFFAWSERKHIWKRRADEADYDALEKRETAAARKRLRGRVKGNGRKAAPVGDDADD